MAFIEKIAAVTPPYGYDQEELKKAACVVLPDLANGYSRIFAHARVSRRYFTRPIEWYTLKRGFREKNEDSVDGACSLAGAAVAKLLQETDLSWPQVHQLLVVNSTSLATPTLDALLIHRTALPKTCKRTPLFGLGCVGGAVGLARASALAVACPQDNIVLAAVEVCGHAFNAADKTAKNMIAASLFADGAAGVLLRGRRSASSKAQVLATHSVIFPNSIGVMGWSFSELGLGLVLSSDLPDVVRRHLKEAFDVFLKFAQIAREDIRHYLTHPGGPKVIEAVEDALGLRPQDLRWSWNHLKNFGNLSSASVLFILNDLLTNRAARPGDLGLLFALGPGFSAEFILLRFL